MVKRRTDSPRLEVLPADALAEDLLGLNLRGLRSVRVLWVHPRRYFAAAETLDWEGTYTPSIRLWLSFFALYSFMKVWWIGGNAGMIDAYASGFANAGMVLPEHVTFEQVGREAALFAFGLAPVLQIISMVVLSLIYPFWGRKTSLALRQRFLFATIIPGASLMPVFMTAMVFVPSAWLTAYGIALAVVTLILDSQTAYRGAYGNLSRS